MVAVGDVMGSVGEMLFLIVWGLTLGWFVGSPYCMWCGTSWPNLGKPEWGERSGFFDSRCKHCGRGT